MTIHPLEKEFITNEIIFGNNENMEKDYGKMGRLETEQENKNFKKWGADKLKSVMGKDYFDKEKIAPDVETVFFTFPQAGKKKLYFKGLNLHIDK